MKLLIVTGIFPPDIGGPATYVLQMATALADRGHQVKVITLSDRIKHADRFSFSVIRLRRSELLLPRLLRTTLRIVRQGRHVDLLYVNGLQFESTIANFWLRKPLAMKIVGDIAWERCTRHGWTHDGFERFQKSIYGIRIELLRHLRAWWSRRAHCVIAPSQYLADVIANWGVTESRIHVIHNAPHIPGAKVAVSISIHTPIKIVTAGRLIPLKNIDRILRVLTGIPEAGLVIVGDGPDRPRLESMTADLGLTSRVQFAGCCTLEETHAFLAACDIFVLNSSHEGLPHVVLEAMSHALPVLATAVGGIPEVLEEEVNGRLIRPDDDDQLRHVLAELVRSSEEREQLSIHARIRASTFSLPRVVEATERLLLALCREDSGTIMMGLAVGFLCGRGIAW